MNQRSSYRSTKISHSVHFMNVAACNMLMVYCHAARVFFRRDICFNIFAAVDTL